MIKSRRTLRNPRNKKRLEAEQRQAKYRLEQEAKRKQDVIKQLQDAEKLILNEMARLETHTDHKRVADLAKRLGEIKKKKSRNCQCRSGAGWGVKSRLTCSLTSPRRKSGPSPRRWTRFRLSPE